ncbi:hypothetical protein BJX70DRAFT_405368 [Aspergillus crustosus]
MRWLTAALSPLVLATIANTSPVQVHTSDIDGHNETTTLVRRVRTGPSGELLEPKTITDLFLLDDGPGGCIGQEEVLTDWLQESMQLHGALERLYANVAGDLAKAYLWLTWFGVQFRNGDIDFEDEENAQLWSNIGDHISRVSSFFAGRQLQDPQVSSESPRLFCGADAATFQDWSASVVRDRDGNDVVWSEDPETGHVEYLGLGRAFGEMAGDLNARAFWFDAYNGYSIHFERQESVCQSNSNRLMYANTARPMSSWPSSALSPGVDFEFGRANRHIMLCPPSFNPSGGVHSYPSLARAVHEDTYPTADVRDPGEALTRMLPVSSTLYHEIYHLTDADNTPDRGYTINEILLNARDEDFRLVNSHNPETFVNIAMAAFLYFYPPHPEDDDERCVYLGHFPKSAASLFR